MNRNSLWLLLTTGMLISAAKIHAQGTAFIYQGRLNDGGAPANKIYDLRFALFDDPTNGNAISSPQTNAAVGVTNGLFTTTIDFGPVFTGTNYWLSVGVRTNGPVASTNAFTLLLPRQPLLPVPYAIFANTASNLLGTLVASQLVGTLPSAQVAGTYSGAVNFTNSTNTFTGSFYGNGLGLTNLNASNLSTGTVADARLSSNVALLNTNQTFTGINTFNNVSNSFVGSFFGNGLVGWIPIPSNSVQAVRDTGYLLLNSNLTTVTLPATGTLLTGDIIRISGPGAGGWRVAQNAGQSIVGIFYSPSNADWNPAITANAGYDSIACSADGVREVAGAITTGPGIYNSLDSGQTWSISPVTTFPPISLAASADGSKQVGVVNGGSLIYSTNSGLNWLQANAPSTTWTCIASSANGLRLIASVNSGGIYTNSPSSYVNFGLTSLANPAVWTGVASSANGTNLVAIVNGGRIHTSLTAGATWTTQNGSPSTNWISVATSADGAKLAAVVSNGRIWTSSDYGVSWTEQTSAPTAFWYHIASSADGGRLVATINTLGGNGGGIYVSADFGVTWVPQNVPNEDWYSVACSADGTKMTAVYHGATASGIYYWHAGANTTASTTGAKGSLTGGQGAAVELQYIGNGQFMPISGIGAYWAN